MSHCAVCSQELQQGYGYCHYCGATVGAGQASTTSPLRAQRLVEAVDRFKELSSISREAAGSAKQTFDLVLGGPVSIQRQILYALLSSFALVPGFANRGLLAWLEAWLVVALILYFPICYWMTGVIPMSGVINAVLGPEISLRRRILLAALFTFAPLLFTWWLVNKVPFLSIIYVRVDHPLVGLIKFLTALSASFLSSFYFMGFAASWRSIPGCEASISSERLGSTAPAIAERIRRAVQERAIRGLEVVAVDMGRLRHYTAGDSCGTVGEQISFVCGKARVVVFVQDFGDDLFIRWTGFCDASGRRLWLFIGFFVAAFDRLLMRWFGSSFLVWSRQSLETLSPAGRHQFLMRSARGGLITRTLRLIEGFSEYSWNEIFALEAAVRESVVSILESVAEDQSEADKVRSQIQKHMYRERLLGSLPAQAG